MEVVLHLRAFNKITLLMDSFQPGTPLPSLWHKEWLIIVIDLKDCFYTIYHTGDSTAYNKKPYHHIVYSSQWNIPESLLK